MAEPIGLSYQAAIDSGWSYDQNTGVWTAPSNPQPVGISYNDAIGYGWQYDPASETWTAPGSNWSQLEGINSPTDSAFRGQFANELREMLPEGVSDSQVQQAIEQTSWYGGLGGGSNPYAAAREVVTKLGVEAPYDEATQQRHANEAVARSPEGVARATDEDKGPLGGYGALIGGIAGNIIAPGIGGAIGAGLGGAVDGRSPEQIALSSVLAFLAPEVMSNFSDTSVDWSQGWDGMAGEAPGGVIQETAQGTANGLISGAPAEEVASRATDNFVKVSTDPQEFLNVSASGEAIPGVGKDITGPGLSMGDMSATGSGAGGGLDYMASGDVIPGAAGPTAAGSFPLEPSTATSMAQNALAFLNDNKVLSYGALQLGGGLIKGVADASTAKDLQARNIEAAKELQSNKTDETLRTEAARRAAVQGGSYFDAKLPYGAKGGPLRRPDGTAVYGARGLIAGR